MWLVCVGGVAAEEKEFITQKRVDGPRQEGPYGIHHNYGIILQSPLPAVCIKCVLRVALVV